MSSQLKPNLEKVKDQRRTLFDRTFRDQKGNIVIAQMPNLPLLVGLAASLLQLLLPSSNLQTGIGLVGFGALFTWAWQELFDGVNYFRRALGLVVLVGLIALRLHAGWGRVHHNSSPLDFNRSVKAKKHPNAQVALGKCLICAGETLAIGIWAWHLRISERVKPIKSLPQKGFTLRTLRHEFENRAIPYKTVQPGH